MLLIQVEKDFRESQTSRHFAIGLIEIYYDRGAIEAGAIWLHRKVC